MKKTINIYDYIGEGGITAADISFLLAQINPEETEAVEVHINSNGGQLFEGLAIYNLLREYAENAKLETYIDGIAASIASVIALAGTSVKIYKNAYLFIHNPWTLAIGDNNDLSKSADELEKFRDTLIAIYKAKTSKSEEELKALLDEQTFLNSDEAKELGFVDEVIENYPSKNYVALYSDIEPEEETETIRLAKTFLTDVEESLTEIRTKLEELAAKKKEADEEEKAKAVIEKNEKIKSAISKVVDSSDVLPAVKINIKEFTAELLNGDSEMLGEKTKDLISVFSAVKLDEEFAINGENENLEKTFSADPEFQIDQAQLGIYEKAQALAEKEKISFIEAVRKINKNN
jgi:ATP-dependent Clp endopeptidase proteolytic subunit ClpP